jgi:hypothetical protein
MRWSRERRLLPPKPASTPSNMPRLVEHWCAKDLDVVGLRHHVFDTTKRRVELFDANVTISYPRASEESVRETTLSPLVSATTDKHV